MSIARNDDPENPEWTEEDFARAKSAHELLPAAVLSAFPKTRGRPRQEKTKKQYTVRLDDDVVARLRQEGPGWQSRLNTLLKKTLTER